MTTPCYSAIDHSFRMIEPAELKHVGFFMRHFTGRGVERAIFDYADGNERILGNKSYIIAFTKEAQRALGSEIHFPTMRVDYDRFASRFEVIEINHMREMRNVIETYNLDFFYTQLFGTYDPLYMFDNPELWGNCKTIKHAVFNTTGCEGDYYASISQFLNLRFNTPHVPVIPYMIPFSKEERGITENLRASLGIPENAIVFGRHGARDQFNIPMVHHAITKVIFECDRDVDNVPIYFLFMNTEPFCHDHPHIIHLPYCDDQTYKVKFINTCDAMIHARKDGETFGLAVAEFSIMNKPVITSTCGDIEHLMILKEKAIIYANDLHLAHIFRNFKDLTVWNKSGDWNMYKDYTPERIMTQHFAPIFDKERAN